MPKYKIRIEPFGSLVYDTNTATTVSLDRDETRDYLKFKGKFPSHPKDIMAPRVVHLEITDKCSMVSPCPYCYVLASGHQTNTTSLSTDDWRKVIDILDQSGVFQVTFGGGEPMLREDLVELVNYTSTININTGLTTNGKFIVPSKDSLLNKIGQVNISIHDNPEFVKIKALVARNYTRTGISYLCKTDSMYYLSDIVDFIEYSNNHRTQWQSEIELLLISYKPVIGDKEKVVPSSEIMKLAKEYAPRIPIAVDGHAYNKCEGGYSFCDISCTGEVYPCSFVRTSYGNILEEPFLDIWARMPRITECPYGE